MNAVLPDIIDTLASRSAMAAADFDARARPEEIAAVIELLCSDAARRQRQCAERRSLVCGA